MFVRLICRAQPVRGEAKDLPFWPRLAYRYALALELAGVPTRILSTCVSQYAKGSPWYEVQAARSGDVREGPFTRNIPADEQFLNVVCEVPRVAARMWTLGHVNVAIAAVENEFPPPPKEHTIESELARLHAWRNSFKPYTHYDHVITPSEAAFHLLMRTDVTPLVAGWHAFPRLLEPMMVNPPKTDPPIVEPGVLEKTMDKVMLQGKDAIDKLTRGAF